MKTAIRLLTGFLAGFAIVGAVVLVSIDPASSGSGKPNCSEVWVVGQTLPLDYDGCDLAGTTVPSVPQICTNDGNDMYETNAATDYVALLGGPVLDGEEAARLVAECNGMSGWLFPEEVQV